MDRPVIAHKLVGGGDDLGDEWIPDPPSSGEDAADSAREGSVFAFDDDEDQRPAVTLKRKAQPADDDDDDGQERDLEQPQKKKKKRRKVRPSAAEDALAAAEPARWLRAVQAEDGRLAGLSSLEIEEALIREERFEDTAAFVGERTAEALPQFIQSALPKLALRIGQKPKSPGAPTCIILCAAALRVAELVRVLKSSKLRGDKGGEVAKLFAKHVKLQEHIDYLSKTRISVAVATPSRLQQLLASPNALPLTALTHLIFDVSHVDAKQRHLTDIPEVRGEVCALLRGALGDEVRKGKVKVVVF